MTCSVTYSLLPIIIAAFGTLAVLLGGPFLSERAITVIGVVTSLAAGLVAAVICPVSTLGVSGLAFGPLARYLIPVFALAVALTLLISHGYNRRHGIKGEEYPATVMFALLAMCVLPCATNLLIMFLALEAVAFAFYILVAIDLNRAESAEAGLKYLLFGAVAAALTAFGISLLYAGNGVLTLGAQPAAGFRSAVTAGWGLILIGIAFKLSLVPAHLWTPDVYQGAPAPVVGLHSTTSKLAGTTFLLMLLSFAPPLVELRVPLFLLSLFSMGLGNLAALRQNNLKRMLAYSSIAHMGYVALAVLTGTRDAYSSVLLYGALYTVMNLAAFGAISSLSGSGEREQLSDYAGLGFTAPFRGGVLALSMLALAGIPPTAGFIGKFFIFYAAIRGGQLPLAVTGILFAAISAFFYLRVVVQLYMRQPEAEAPGPCSPAESFALALLALAILVLGVYPGPLLRLVDAALSHAG
jgi:NADH-quinone oxidoreductase subunit N